MYQRYHIVYDDLYVHTTTAAVPSTVAEYAIANMPNDNLSHNIQIYPAEPGNLDGVTSDDYDGSEMQKQMRKQTPADVHNMFEFGFVPPSQHIRRRRGVNPTGALPPPHFFSFPNVKNPNTLGND